MSQIFKEYAEQINQHIAEFVLSVKNSRQADLKADSSIDKTWIAQDAFFEILSRGGKRMRGVLLMNAYFMAGGRSKKAILDVALALELAQAYVLVIDDIQDCSDTRRDGPSAHRLIEGLLQKTDSQEGDLRRTSESIATNGAIWGAHKAGQILAEIDADFGPKLRAISIFNKNMQKTADGQTLDLLLGISGKANREEVLELYKYKTAYYSILNPIQIGLALAGTPDEVFEYFIDYGINTGLIFQTIDDALPYISESMDKDQFSDIKEGKQTLIYLKAKDILSSSHDKKALEVLGSCFGKKDHANAQYEEFLRVISKTGAVQEELDGVSDLAKKASAVIENVSSKWPNLADENVEFFKNLPQILAQRTR